MATAGKSVVQQCPTSRKESRPKALGWSDLHADLLAEIFMRLDVVDYIRCLSVCASWRSVPDKTMNLCKPNKDGQPPWLLISSPDDDPTSRSFYAPSHFHARTAKFTMHLPQIANHRCIGSSRGFLVTVDPSENLFATNPLTGARFPIPPTATHPDILIHRRLVVPADLTGVFVHRKAIISPSRDAIAVSAEGFAPYVGDPGRHFPNLAFARAGDDSWTPLVPPSPRTRRFYVEDFIFHKGCIYALFSNGHLVAFDPENPASPPLFSPMLLERELFSSLGFLFESPDRQDLLLLLIHSKTSMVVSMLDKNTLEWVRVHSIGDVALFIDGSYLSSLSTREFPCLKSNCIYTSNLGCIGQIRVYDLEDGSICPLSPDVELGQLLPPLLWFTPALL